MMHQRSRQQGAQGTQQRQSLTALNVRHQSTIMHKAAGLRTTRCTQLLLAHATHHPKHRTPCSTAPSTNQAAKTEHLLYLSSCQQ